MARHDPFAPLSPRAQRRQARQSVNSMLMPLLRQINQEFNRRSLAGTSAISGYTNQLASQLAPFAGQTHRMYAAAEDKQRNLDEALYAHLSGQGQHVLDNQVGVGPMPAAELAKISLGAAGANQAIGSSYESQLIGQGASAENYNRQLPGIARVGGASKIKDLISQLEFQRNTQSGKLRAQIPGLVQRTLGDIRNTELQKAVAIQSGLISGQKLSAQVGYQNARINQGARRLNIQGAHYRNEEALSLARNVLSRDNYNLAVQKENRLAATKTGKAGKKGFTPKQLSDFRSQSVETVKRFKNGLKPILYADGSVRTPGLPAHRSANPAENRKHAMKAYEFLLIHGFPPSIAFNAVGYVYGKWAPAGTRSPHRRRRDLPH